MQRVELGCIGHFVLGHECMYRRHTQIGRYAVSTVGDLYVDGVREPVCSKPDRYFETKVFELTDDPVDDSEGCGCRELVDYSERDSMTYATAGEAHAGHEAMVEKWVSLQGREASQ